MQYLAIFYSIMILVIGTMVANWATNFGMPETSTCNMACVRYMPR